MKILSSLFCVGWFVDAVSATCPDALFLGCVLRLKAQRAPFEKNMLNVVFNIGSEAKLLHTCKVYGDIMPCFRDKIAECGDDRQRRMLNEVGKLLMFLCSPFSLKRQRKLIVHQKCIASILDLPATTGCQLDDYAPGIQVLKCREYCTTRAQDFICMMKTWISEQNVCTVKDIYEKCGTEAAEFYSDLQSTVFEPQFPILCDAPEPITHFTTTSTPFSNFVQTSSYPTISTTDDISDNRIDIAYPLQASNSSVVQQSLNPALPPRRPPPTPKPLPLRPSYTVRPAYYNSINIPEHVGVDHGVYRKPASVFDPRLSSRLILTSTRSPQPVNHSAHPYYPASTPTPARKNSSDTVMSLLKKFFPDNFPISLSSLLSKKSAPMSPPIAVRETYSTDTLPQHSWNVIALSTPSSDSQIAKTSPPTTPTTTVSTTTLLPMVTFTSAPKYAPGVKPLTTTTTEKSTTTQLLSMGTIPPRFSSTRETSPLPSPTTPSTTSIDYISTASTAKWKPWYLGGDVVMLKHRKMEKPYMVG